MPGIVMCRDALLHRSHEIQPAHFDSFFYFFTPCGTCLDHGTLFRAKVQEVVSKRAEPMAETLLAQAPARKRNDC